MNTARLRLHKGTGQWYCLLPGSKRRYLGTDRQEAERRVQSEQEMAREVVPAIPVVSLAEAIDSYLGAKEQEVCLQQIQNRTLREYRDILRPVRDRFGSLTLNEVSRRSGDLLRCIASASPNITRKRVIVLRSVLHWAYNHDLIDQPVRMAGLKAPSKAQSRRWKAQQPAKMFSREQIRTLLDATAGTWLHPCLLLGISCGLHSVDVSGLERRHISPCGEYISYARQKTGVARECWLWPELRGLELPIRNNCGARLIIDYPNGGQSNSIVRQFGRLRKRLGWSAGSFSWLRHTFRTVADEMGDPNAVRRAMGHEIGQGMDSVYVQRINPHRLKAVGVHVRGWLFSGD